MPPRAAAQLAERAGLAAWAPTAPVAPDDPAESAETQRLLRLLLTIYTSAYVTSSKTQKTLIIFMTPTLQDYRCRLTHDRRNGRCKPPCIARAIFRRP